MRLSRALRVPARATLAASRDTYQRRLRPAVHGESSRPFQFRRLVVGACQIGASLRGPTASRS